VFDELAREAEREAFRTRGRSGSSGPLVAFTVTDLPSRLQPAALQGCPQDPQRLAPADAVPPPGAVVVRRRSATGSSPASTRGTSGPATAPAGAKVRAVVRRERVRVHGAAAGESALGESRADGSRRQHAVVFRLIGHHEGVGLRALVRLCPTFPMLTAKRRGTAARAVAAPRRARSRPRGSAPSCGRPGSRTRAPTPSRSR